MTSTQKIVVDVPSYKAYHRLTTTFIPSFARHIPGQGRHAYHLILNCEGYTDKQLTVIRALCDRFLPGAYVLTVNDYPKPASLTQIRHDTCLIAAEHAVHLLADDDFEFRPGSVQCYDAAVDYMLANPQCGMVVCKGFLGGSKWGTDIRPAFGGFSFMGQGLLVRMIRDPDCATIFPDNVLGIPGRYEDPYLGFHFWSRGFFVAKMFNVPTLHNHCPWGSKEIEKCMQGCQAVPLHDNGKNPRIVLPCMGSIINNLVGDFFYTDGSAKNMKRMLDYRPKESFWKAYVIAAIRRFGYWALRDINKDMIQRGYSTRLSRLGLDS
jgi:hypothetical protein